MVGNALGNLTYFDDNLGASTVDFGICCQMFYKYIYNFMTLPQTELSDHCKIVTEIRGCQIDDIPIIDSYNWKNIDGDFWWDENIKEKFTK